MTNHQFMAQFYDFPIKCVQNYFLRFYSLLFDAFLNHRFMAQEFWHNFSMRGWKHYSEDELDQLINEYWNGTKMKIVCDHSPHTPRRTITRGALRKRQNIAKNALGLILFRLLKLSLTCLIGSLGCRFRDIQWPEIWSCWKEMRSIGGCMGRLDRQGIWGGGGWIDSWIDIHCWQLEPLKWSSLWEL